MLARSILAISLLFATVCVASAEERHQPNSISHDADGKLHLYGANGLEAWYVQDEKPETLKAALAADKDFLGAGTVGFRMMGDPRVCSALRSVKLPCDYNSRGVLSMFLTVNGKGLFPASSRTNPYCPELNTDDTFPDDCYIGRQTQNAMLAAAILKNRKLFRDGDLTAETVRTQWR
jgi:hypothetical protein